MTDSLPYVNAYGQLPALLDAIKKAGVPPKVNRDFVSGVLNLKSSSYLAMIPFLKRLGLIDSGNNPTQDYKDFRDETISRSIMAKCIKISYEPLFLAHEYAYRLTKDQIKEKVKTITGLPDGNKVVDAIVGTFSELNKLADFESKLLPKEEHTRAQPTEPIQKTISQTKLGLNYTINLNLPPTTNIEVFNAIFKSLKEHILHD